MKSKDFKNCIERLRAIRKKELTPAETYALSKPIWIEMAMPIGVIYPQRHPSKPLVKYGGARDGEPQNPVDGAFKF